MYKQIEIIAEVKTKSPTGKKSERTWDELFNIANEAGGIISIHTNSIWGGSFKLLKKARILTKKPTVFPRGLIMPASGRNWRISKSKGVSSFIPRPTKKYLWLSKFWPEPRELSPLLNRFMPLRTP